MSFSDEKLNRMEIACLLSVEEYRNQDAKDILALIARLKAAEKVVDEVRWRTDEPKYVMDIIDAWRKAAGK